MSSNASGVKHDPPWQKPAKLVIPKRTGKDWQIGTVQSVEKTDTHTLVVLRLDDSDFDRVAGWQGEDVWLELVQEK